MKKHVKNLYNKLNAIFENHYDNGISFKRCKKELDQISFECQPHIDDLKAAYEQYCEFSRNITKKLFDNPEQSVEFRVSLMKRAYFVDGIKETLEILSLGDVFKGMMTIENVRISHYLRNIISERDLNNMILTKTFEEIHAATGIEPVSDDDIKKADEFWRSLDKMEKVRRAMEYFIIEF